jgi:hypothetical protein
VYNSFVLDFPEELGALANKIGTSQALVTVVKAWNPDWAAVISRKARAARHFVPGKPFVDWMIYLRELNIDPRALPAAASVITVCNGNSIVIAQDEPVDSDNPSQVRNVESVEKALLG